ncbi:hypothetical protein B0H14DRAFT_2598436 [Mycena olivaceomarginata]|nr:hypothetical protein B0H14DRAFT_2598436 [Mycena olivaceomarginata]
MSEDGSPAPVTPRRKRSVRISTGARKPPPLPANRYLDLEAVESGDSGEEENLDKYETDFIDDGDDVDPDDGVPCQYYSHPVASIAFAYANEASGKASRAGHTSLVDPTPISPMTTRSRSKKPIYICFKITFVLCPRRDFAEHVRVSGYDSSRTYAVAGVKSASVLPGTERGDTQAKLEMLRAPSSNITVNMDREEHEQFMLFKNSKKPSFKQVCSLASLYILMTIVFVSATVEGGVKPKTKGAPSDSSLDAVTDSSTLSAGTSQVGAAIANLPAPTWKTSATVYKSAGPKDATTAERDLAGSNATSNRMNEALPSAANTSEDTDNTSVQAGVKRKRHGLLLLFNGPLAKIMFALNEVKDMNIYWERSGQKVGESDGFKDNAAASDSEMAVDVDQVSLPTKGSSRAVAKNGRQSVPNRQEAVGGSRLPKVPIAEFARLKGTSPEKKPKRDEVVLHTVDVKSVKELPGVCEVTNVELQDPMMKSIYALDLPKLRTVWALLLLVQKGHHINPARIDPRLLEARSPVHGRDGPRKRWVLSIGERPAVCVSVVNTTRSSLRDISTVYGGSSAPLLKYILGVHLSQDFDQITGLCGMVFDLELMHVQLNMSALTFGTKGIPIDKYGYPKHLQSLPQADIAPSDSLNYDDDSFDASVDIENLPDILPLYKGEIPANSCTAVGYTISNFVKASGRSEEQHLSFNIRWVVVLGEPE